jgi:carbon monoxide dehydrogenase subunit G
MEVRLDKQYPVAASVEQAWAVLSDVRATAACMPGAQITEQLDDTHYKGTVRSKVGPAVMTFGGEIEVLALDAATRSLQMLGKGADKSGSSAQMNLSAHVEPGAAPGESVLVGQATITVSGKLAQFGSRLLVPVSDAMLAQFADNFRAAASAVPAPGAAAGTTAAAGCGEETTVIRMVQGGQQPAPTSGEPAAAPVTPATPVAPAPVRELNVLALLWTVVKGWFAGLFRRR